MRLDMTEGTVARRFVPCLICCRTEIFNNKHPHGTGTATAMANGFDLTHEAVYILPLALTDFGQRIPQFRLQAHARAAAFRNHVAIDQSTTRHGCPLN